MCQLVPQEPWWFCLGQEPGQAATAGQAGEMTLPRGYREPRALLLLQLVLSQYDWTISRIVAGVAIVFTLFGIASCFVFPALAVGDNANTHAHRK